MRNENENLRKKEWKFFMFKWVVRAHLFAHSWMVSIIPVKH